MIKCVLDTNVIISGIVIPGSVPGKVLKAGLTGKYQMVISQEILEEIERVIEYPRITKWLQKRRKALAKVRVVVKQLEKVSILTPGNLKVEEVKADPKDNMFLACALEGKADFIISGDRHLKNLKEYKGIRIVEPTEFLRRVGEAG